MMWWRRKRWIGFSKINAALQFLFGCKTSKYDGILKNAQNQLEKFDLCIQDLEGGQESLLSHLIETSLHYLTSSTTSPPIYAGSTFLNCVVIFYFKIIYFWLLIKKNNGLMDFFIFFLFFWVYWFPRRHGTCTAMFTCLLDIEHA